MTNVIAVGDRVEIKMVNASTLADYAWEYAVVTDHGVVGTDAGLPTWMPVGHAMWKVLFDDDQEMWVAPADVTLA